MKLFKNVCCMMAALCGFITLSQAQDRIYRINPVEVIEGKVLEIGENNVRYSRWDTRPDVIFNVPTQYLQKIVFEDGKELVYNDVVNVANDRRDAIKISFLSPAYDATTLFYERGIKPGQSLEFGAGVIGLGIEEVQEDAGGIILKAGYKFITRPEYYQNRFRYAHLLKGSYIKPELTFVHYSYKEYGYGCVLDEWEYDVTLLNVGVVGGKQWVFQNFLLLDLFCGIGLAFGNNDNSDGWHYNFVGNKVTCTAGFKVGFLLGKSR